MTPEALFDILRHAMLVASAISAPMLITALIVGLVVGLFQALTTVQEMTLTFVPKMCAMLLAFWMSMDFMTQSLKSFFNDFVITSILSF